MFKIVFRKFSPPHRSTLLCSNIVKFCRREIGEIVRYLGLPDKKSSASQTVAIMGTEIGNPALQPCSLIGISYGLIIRVHHKILDISRF